MVFRHSFWNGLLSMISVFLISCFFYASTFAAGVIPRSDLRLELLLSTWSQDTSGNNRVVTSTWAAPIYETDSVYGISSAKFNGGGGLLVNTSWASTTDNYTISFWVKHSWLFSTWTTVITWSTIKNNIHPTCPSCSDYNYNTDIYSTTIWQNIFTSWPEGWIKLVMSSAGKCSIRWGNSLVNSVSVFGWTTRTPAGVLVNYYTNFYSMTDVGTNLQESFNCTQLLDKRWHNITLMRRNSSTLSIYIDGLEVTRLISWPFSIGRNITIWQSSTNTSYYSWKFLPSQIGAIGSSKYLRGNVAWFRIYSRALNDDELEAIFDEFRYAQSDLAWAWGIQIGMERYSKPNLYIRLKNILPSLSKDNVTYEYSTDNKFFYPITDITNMSVWTGSLDYSVGIDLSGKPDGKITISLRVRGSGNAFQSIGTVSFVKMDIATGIAINMPNSDQANSKTITAEAPGATLTMYITTSSICDSTIGTGSFEEYSDLTFTNKSDNGKRVCYKAVYPSINKTVYRLSGIIQWIQPDMNIKLFDNYLLWYKSLFPKQNDSTSLILDLLAVSASASQWTINGITMTDINGDGLVDFLYSRNDPVRRAILVNNGNYTFRTVYRCTIDPIKDVYGIVIWNTYYWDCADPTR